MSRDLDFSNFTVDAYRELLQSAKRSYAFEPFGSQSAEAHVLWRHDVDFSVHRAVKLARIEAEQDLRATYFFWLHSDFYNLLERQVLDLAREIVALGHWAGLHFDPTFYGPSPAADLAEQLQHERELLSDWLKAPIDSLSFHNPEVAQTHRFDSDSIAGMVNVYGRAIRESYCYVSDSNGYWRHARLPEILRDASEPRVHVLTHPEWWQDEPMSPRSRVVRCLEGRSRRTLEAYDRLLADWGRDNVA
jgi:hypothetical protein